ncbi:MAG: hypothetical protein M3P18_18585 [Actinomycetota bacterium]|nr:hypothetical protein [Actinomycetota bacterium]
MTNSVTEATSTSPSSAPDDPAVLDEIQRRVLWLSTLMVHHAGRPGGPIITVLDGHPSALAWVGSMQGVRAWPLGVSHYGESGTRDELYRQHGIDATSIAATCRTALNAILGLDEIGPR